jgi:ribosomal-protein-alanine acetyltransferase
VKIRPATCADIPFLMNLERQCATAGHWTEEQYRQAFQREGPSRLMIVSEASNLVPSDASGAVNAASGGVLGFLIARHLAPEWELENIIVAPAARGKAIGKQLLDALSAAARETNSSSVFLEVRESNAAARTLYEMASFEQTGRRKFYYTNPAEDAILYRRTLP